MTYFAIEVQPLLIKITEEKTTVYAACYNFALLSFTRSGPHLGGISERHQ